MVWFGPYSKAEGQVLRFRERQVGAEETHTCSRGQEAKFTLRHGLQQNISQMTKMTNNFELSLTLNLRQKGLTQYGDSEVTLSRHLSDPPR